MPTTRIWAAFENGLLVVRMSWRVLHLWEGEMMRWASGIQVAPWQKCDRATPSSVLAAGPFKVYSFRELLQRNAEVVSRNPQYSIFYRGQARQYSDRDGRVTILPSIYRGVKPRQKNEMRERFERLESTVDNVRKALDACDAFKADSRRLRTVSCWAIIQHYGLCDTPLIDVSQSLRVACAFALQCACDVLDGEGPVVYDIALPFVEGPLTLNANEELYLMKLDSLMPSLALRPFIQESYLVGDELIRRGIEDLSGADLRRRVIASFQLCGDREQWLNEVGFDADALMIRDDGFSDLKHKISDVIEDSARTSADQEEMIEKISEVLLQFADILKVASSRSD